jgi:PAS domain S-box-containing protein
MGQVVYESDPVRGGMTFFGDVERLLGFTAAEMKGGRAQWVQRIPPEDQSRFNQAAPSAEGQPQRLEYRFCRKDGALVWLRDTRTVFQEQPGGKKWQMGALQDITGERKLLTQFQYLQKKQVLGELAGVIAHDFNNLLTIFNGYTEILQELTAPEDVQSVYLNEMEIAVERARGLTSQLLYFGHVSPVPPGPTRLGPLLIPLCRMLRRIVAENIEWSSSILDENGWVATAPRQIETLCINLVLNACAAMPEGGRLGLALAPTVIRRTDRRVQAGWKPGSYLRLTVSDTGTGMDEPLLAKIFEPSFTTQPCGSGLGLTVCREIVEQSGGQISVETAPGKGSSFHIFLPRIKPPPASKARPAAKAFDRTPGGKGEKILVVEDDAAACKVLAASLRQLGYRVLCASNGEQALRFIEKEREIALVISDWIMPLMSGVELIQRLRDQKSPVPIVLISGYASIPKEINDPHFQPLYFMTKPLSLNALANKLRELLDV